MGPRAAPGPGRGRPAAPGLELTMSQGPAAGRGRSRGPHAGDKPGTRADKAPARTDKPDSRAGTPRWPRQDQRASVRGGRGGTRRASGRRMDPARLVALEVPRAEPGPDA